MTYTDIYEKYSKNTENTEEFILYETEKTSNLYGATKMNGRWKREIKILFQNSYIYKCPDCNNCHKHLRVTKTE